MKLSVHNPPHIRYNESSRTVMGDTIISLMPLYFMAYFYYGLRVLIIGLVAIVTCLFADWACSLLTRGHINFRDLSPVITGMIISLMMPAAIEPLVVVSASLFAILIIKAPFGGSGNNLFNPAAGGIAFATVCWSGKMLAYTEPLQHLPINFGAVGEGIKFLQGPAAALKLGGMPNTPPTELLLGNFPGPMGATNVLIIFACLMYLLVRCNVKWFVPGAYLATAAAIAVFARPIGSTAWEAVCHELTSGSLIFIAAFMLPEPLTLPKRNLGKLTYAITAGVVTMLFRYYGTLEQTAVFALLFMNAISPVFDSFADELALIKPKRMPLQKPNERGEQ